MSSGTQIYPDMTISLTLPAGSWVPFVDAAQATYNLRYDLGARLIATDDAIALRPTSATLAASGGSALVGFIQAGTGAVSQTSQAKLRERVSPQDFGAAGNGSTDDTAAMQAALAALQPGGTLDLGNGYTYLLSESLVLEKPVNIRGGGPREDNILLFSSTGTYVTINAKKALIVALHSTTVLPPYSGNAVGSTIDGLTVTMNGALANTRGIFLCTPCYLTSVSVDSCTSDGFAIVATNGSVAGNANCSSLKDCRAQNNGGHGLYLDGNDANACEISNFTAFGNSGWGVRDESLIGNTYVNPSFDSNTSGSIHTSTEATNRSCGIGGFFEVGQAPVLGTLSTWRGELSDETMTAAVGGVTFNAIPSGDGYFTQALAFASTDDIANTKGAAPNAGAFIGIGFGGIDYRATSTSLRWKLNGLASVNYTDITVDGVPVIRFPNSAVTANISPDRPWFPAGLTLGGAASVAFGNTGTAAPTTGAHVRGEIVFNEEPSAGGFIGWVCVTSGTPGTWKTFGAISA